MLTQREQEYLDMNPRLRRLTFDGINDLFCHPIRGAYTIMQLIELEEVAKNPPPKLASKCEFVDLYSMEMSLEMCMENERCIQKYGMSMFLL